MKITYEPGDIVDVEDNIEAGPLAACTITLVRKAANNDKVWLATLVDCIGGSNLKYNQNYRVKEFWLNPR